MYKPLPKRHRPAHGVKFNQASKTIVFITVCTKDRKPWLANHRIQKVLQNIWTDSPSWLTGKYVILPDHLHLFASPANPQVPLKQWIKFWKSQFQKQFNNPNYRWQAGHWDTRLRKSESYDNKWQYVRNNPVRHKLVKKIEDWPYQGEIYPLAWWD